MCQVLFNYIWKWQNYAVLPRQLPISQRSSTCIQNCPIPGSLKLSSFEPTGLAHLDYHVWSAMLWKYHKLQPKPKTTDELKAALQTIWEELPQKHIKVQCIFISSEEWGLSYFRQHNFVTFRYILTKLGDKVYVLLLNSLVKFHAKICMHCWNINKSHRRVTVMFTLHSRRRCARRAHSSLSSRPSGFIT